jgi:hypothetical protein
MSDVTGSLSIGDGFSIKYDLNPSTSNPTLKLTLMWESTVTIASTTLTKDDASATFGGKVPDSGGLEAEATASFNFTTLVLTASVVVTTPGIPHVTKSTSKTYGPVSTTL